MNRTEKKINIFGLRCDDLISIMFLDVLYIIFSFSFVWTMSDQIKYNCSREIIRLVLCFWCWGIFFFWLFVDFSVIYISDPKKRSIKIFVQMNFNWFHVWGARISRINKQSNFVVIVDCFCSILCYNLI